jgi:EAL and modified HD-GYP domain-containing signal transduction protein
MPFINFTAKTLINGDYKLLPPQTVIEVLETVPPTDEVLRACRDAKEAGYVLALDDFVYSPGYEPLIQLADIIKIDFLVNKTHRQRQAYVHGFHRHNTCLLAEKVETHEDFQEAIDLGYSYVQGYFFSKPHIMSARDIPGYKRNYLLFLAEVNRPQIDFDRVERLVKSEVALSFKLLRHLNSAHFGLRSRIHSAKQALLLLGEQPLRKWASLVAVTCLAEDKPVELTVTTLVRAAFCERCAAELNLADRQFDLFLLGMLSTLDAVLDRPLAEVLSDIALPFDVTAALLGSNTAMGDLLLLAQACEQGDMETITHFAEEWGIDSTRVAEHFAHAIGQADEWLGRTSTHAES